MTCSLAPPQIPVGLRVPGGLYAGESTFFLINSTDVVEGERVRLQVDSGLCDIKGSVGRVPSEQRFQLVGLPEDEVGRSVVMTISTTVPCPECGMADFNLYIMVTNIGEEPANFDIWLDRSPPEIIPGMSYGAGVALIVFITCLLASFCALCSYIVYLKTRHLVSQIAIDSDF